MLLHGLDTVLAISSYCVDTIFVAGMATVFVSFYRVYSCGGAYRFCINGNVFKRCL